MDPSKLPYVDRPEVPETFANNLHQIEFGNGLMTLTFAIGRLDLADVKPGQQEVQGKRYTAARLVLPAAAADELQRKLVGMMQAVQKAQSQPQRGTKQ